MRAVLLTIGKDLTLAGHLGTVAVGAAAAFTLTAVGGSAPYTITVETEDLPAEWTITPNTDGTVDVVTSEALEAGVYSATFRLKDGDRDVRLITRTLRVVALPLEMSGVLANMTVGSAYSDTVDVTGGVGDYTIIAAALPAGIAAALAGGVDSPITVSGTPTGAGLGPGTSIPFTVSITVEDEDGNQAEFVQGITVTVAALSVTGNLTDATEGVPYSVDLTRAGGVGLLSITSATGLPSGLSATITGSGSASTVRVSGTPAVGTTSGSPYSVTIQGEDVEGNTYNFADSLVVGTPIVYATWNSADRDADLTLSNGNLTFSTLVANFATVRATVYHSSGKHYWETTEEGPGSYAYCGISQSSTLLTDNWIGNNASSISGPLPISGNLGQCFRAAGVIATYPGVTTGPHTVRHKLDLDAGTYEVAVNGGSFMTVATGLTGAWTPAATTRFQSNPAASGTANFGASAFAFAVPSGYRAGFYS